LWTGVFFCWTGAIANWYINTAILRLLGVSQIAPGGALMGFACACLLLAAALYSTTACCVLGPLPGVGTSRANFCCAERDIGALPPEAAAPAEYPPTGGARDAIYSGAALGIVPPLGSAQWKAQCGCYVYPYFCGTCAASDVAEHLEPGTWWNYCCCLVLQGFIPFVGAVLNVCKILDTRRALALRDGIQDDAEFCGLCCCTPCYIGQELAHIEVSKDAATGVAKAAHYYNAHPPTANPPAGYPYAPAAPPAAYAPEAGLRLASPPPAPAAVPALEARLSHLSASHAQAVAALEQKHQAEVGALLAM
jgi:hypothetical protein